MSVNWHDLLLVWLHDPPDQVLDLQGALSRAARYVRAACGPQYSEDTLLRTLQDEKPLALEARLPLPPDDSSVDFLTAPGEHARRVHHPLSGAFFQLPLDCHHGQLAQQCTDVITDLTRYCGDDQARFLALWRFLPAKLAAVVPGLALLPADARMPDLTIWNNLDLRVALAAALSDGQEGALLSFTLGPVQSFIAQARSIRDLWAGSYLLSWLTFAAMKPVLEAYGPTALIFPGLRGNPLYDMVLGQRYNFEPFTVLNPKNPLPQPDVLLTGSLPNTFLALVPASAANDLAQNAEQACRKTWKDIGDAVLSALESKWDHRAQWAIGWEDQVEHFWEIRVTAVPLQPRDGTSLADHFATFLNHTNWPPSDATTTLAQVTHVGENGSLQVPKAAPAGTWALHTALAGRVLATTKQVRHIPQHAHADDHRSKCTLMGTFEQMGPRESAREQRRFWEERVKPLEGTHLRLNERLCAVALIKRFCWVAYFTQHLQRQPADLRFSDTATIAAHEWLQAAGIDPDSIRKKYHDWSGQWLFQDPQSWERIPSAQEAQDLDPSPPPTVRKLLREARQDAETAGREPPLSYYAAIVMDGDHMGKWLSGDQAPLLREVYHPQLVAAFEALHGQDAAQVRQALGGKRPMSPALHMAITAALGNFARDFVPDIVETDFHGELVYAGGDDVLALLPTRYALPCLAKLRTAYSGDGGTLGDTTVPKGWAVKQECLLTLMGDQATASAGLAVAHYKADLRDVLQAAREAEHAAKQAGRDALGIAVLRRSGEHSHVICPWNFVPVLIRLVQAFADGASDRWAYHLHADMDTLAFLSKEAVAAEIIRVVNRGELTSRRKLVAHLSAGRLSDPVQAGAQMADCYRRLRHQLKTRAQAHKRDVTEAKKRAYTDFVSLVHAASFLARGRDKE